jgi:signal transduction histidine kinase/ligand-binding sensor domain-containing protein
MALVFNACGRLAVGFLIAALCASPLFAVNPNLSLNQYLHTSWNQETGNALPAVHSLAQTADGYLWLGTHQGLLRFDGMRFVNWAPTSGKGLPNSNINCVAPAAEGGLWVGMSGAVCRVDRGRVISYRGFDTLPCPGVISMLQDHGGNLWVINTCANSNGRLLVLSRDGAVRSFGAADGLPDQPLYTLFEDRAGKLWIGTGRGVCRWSPGSTAECSGEPARNITSIAQSPDGAMFVSDIVSSQVFGFERGAMTQGTRIPGSTFQLGAMICDRDGNVWQGTNGQGLLRIRNGHVDRFTRTEGLSNNLVNSVLEDREGDIWVATARGVDRIRDPKVQLYTSVNGLPAELITTAYGSRDGQVWLGTAHGLNRIQGELVSKPPAQGGLPNSTVTALFEDPSGKLWVGTNAGLGVQTGSQFVPVPVADGKRLMLTLGLAGDRSGSVWLSDSKSGLFSVRGGVAHQVTVPGETTPDITGILAASSGELWLGHYGGGITVLHGDTTKRYDSHDGLGKGPVRALLEYQDGSIWAGTGEGLSRFRDGHWATWGTAQGLPDGGVQGLVDDGLGCLWLLTPAGVVRLSMTDLSGSAKSIPIVLYGLTEGLRLGPAMTTPRLTRSRDGRLWVCTEDGVAAIDPSRIRTNPVPPPVVIEQVLADGQNSDPFSSREIAFRGRDLQITYTGNSLMVPERVQFRYRLENRDSKWVEAGTRRDAGYTNLRPGQYKFQVIASNNDGVWNNKGAEIALRVDPYFYQTTWFLALCASTILLAIWSAHRIQVRSAVARVQLISAERVRFARELHDSLLQGFSGVVYLLQAAAVQFESAPDVSKQRLERALDQADQSLREARQMIVSMRVPALDNSSLPEALRSVTAQMMADLPVVFEFEVKGKPHQGPYDVEANLLVIAREAVTNALNHAEAKRIRLEMAYTPNQLKISIQDDGRGFDTAAAMAKSGHFGFRGMHERARQIGAALTAKSAPAQGTTIEVVVIWKK